jgi:hypothetical protein
MAEVKDAYKFVKYIHSDRYDKFIEQRHGKFKDSESAMTETVDDYIEYRKIKLRRTDVFQSWAYALDNGYIQWLDKGKSMLGVTPIKGTHLLGKKFWIYRAGLIDDSLKAYGRSQRFFIGLGFGSAVGTLIGILIKAAWDKIISG